MAGMISRLADASRLVLGGLRLREVRLARDSVFITGCDSGIGLCLAKYLASLGCHVFAGVLRTDSDGARELRDFGQAAEGRVHIVEIDVTDQQKTVECAKSVEQCINERDLELSAVINNAGIMIFGEFEWQTNDLIQQQIDVNLIGSMRVAKAFCPLLRKFKGRLINMSSHCSTVPLPCLSVYSATKAAIEAWSSALALEMYKFNVQVITIHPGSYVQETKILKNHSEHTKKMMEAMSPELRKSAEPHFKPLMNYMAGVCNPSPIQDTALQTIIKKAIFSRSPKHNYVNSPWRYSFYYGLISFVRPFWSIRRKIILAFMALPMYK